MAVPSRYDCSVRYSGRRYRSRVHSPANRVPRCARQYRLGPLPPPTPGLRAATSLCACRVHCSDWLSSSTSLQPDHTVPRCSTNHYHIRPPPPPRLRIAAARRDGSVRCPGCRSPSTSPQPDRTVPHCLSNYCCIHPPPAPCLRAAASPCDCSVRCPCCRSPSTSRSPNHTVLHCSKHRHHWILRPPAPCH